MVEKIKKEVKEIMIFWGLEAQKFLGPLSLLDKKMVISKLISLLKFLKWLFESSSITFIFIIL